MQLVIEGYKKVDRPIHVRFFQTRWRIIHETVKKLLAYFPDMDTERSLETINLGDLGTG